MQAQHAPSDDRVLLPESGADPNMDVMREDDYLLNSSSLPSLDELMEPLSAERTFQGQRTSRAGSGPMQ